MAHSSNTHMVTSQASAISQLTEQVSQIKLENWQILNWFDWLAAQMEAFMAQLQSSNQHHARGHSSESSKPP